MRRKAFPQSRRSVVGCPDPALGGLDGISQVKQHGSISVFKIFDGGGSRRRDARQACLNFMSDMFRDATSRRGFQIARNPGVGDDANFDRVELQPALMRRQEGKENLSTSQRAFRHSRVIVSLALVLRQASDPRRSSSSVSFYIRTCILTASLQGFCLGVSPIFVVLSSTARKLCHDVLCLDYTAFFFFVVNLLPILE